MNAINTISLVLCLSLFAAAPALAKPGVCKSVPPDIKEAMRTMSFCITEADPTPGCRAAGMDVKIFNNNEGKLPNAGRGQEYWEGKILKDVGVPGQRRLVYLVNAGAKKNVVQTRYYTPDHYANFCELN